MIYIISIIIWGTIWGVATNAVIKNKGYDENWFFWGFFFCFFALIVALTKPDNKSHYYSDPREDEDLLRRMRTGEGSGASGNISSSSPAATWECAFCYKKNPLYVGTCGCGRTKEETDEHKAKVEKTKKEMELKEMQNILSAQSAPVQRQALDEAEQIKKFKELLDSGIITQEEFDAKKKQLLGL